MEAFFKSVVDQDKAAIVICDTDHIIRYMNPAAIARYEKFGGANMVGGSILDCHPEPIRKIMIEILEWFQQSPENNMVFEGPGTKENKDVYTVALRDADKNVIGYYEKHEYHDKNTNPKFWPFRQ